MHWDWKARGRVISSRIVAVLVAALLCALATLSRCFAQVQLPAVNLGDTNFEDGFAGRGWLLEEFPDVYAASELKDSNGNTVPGNNSITSFSTITHVAFISNVRTFGGWLAGEVLQPVVSLEVQLASGSPSSLRGIADPTIGAGIQWDPKKIGKGAFVQRAVLDIDVPLGKYNDARALNIGNHFIAVNPYYALTYERKRLEFSARLHYLWNSTNNDPFKGLGIQSLQPGQAFHMNYSTSYEVLKSVRLGFNGYWLQQTTDNRINGLDVPHSEERTIGIGPGLQFGGHDTWFRLNSYIETDVRNRPTGIRVTFRISKALPTLRPHQ